MKSAQRSYGTISRVWSSIFSSTSSILIVEESSRLIAASVSNLVAEPRAARGGAGLLEQRPDLAGEALEQPLLLAAESAGRGGVREQHAAEDAGLADRHRQRARATGSRRRTAAAAGSRARGS